MSRHVTLHDEHLSLRRIGEGESVFVVAEIGSNHHRDLGVARASIAAAQEAGADAVKFQVLDVGEQYHDPAPSIRDLHARIDLDEAWIGTLKAEADRHGLFFFASPTYLRAVDLLEGAGVALHKLASAQVGTFPQLVDAVARTGKPALLSTGLVTYGGLEAALQAFDRVGNDQVVVLHCNSRYPTPFEAVHLPRMATYRQMSGGPVGFSDHTPGTAVALAAVAQGASVIEKHFVLDPALDTPDAPFSLDPTAFGRLVADIRAVEQAMLERPRRSLDAAEATFRDRIIERLILARDKLAGAAFSEGDFEIKRASTGVDARDAALVTERFAAAEPLAAGTVLQWSMLRGAA